MNMGTFYQTFGIKTSFSKRAIQGTYTT